MEMFVAVWVIVLTVLSYTTKSQEAFLKYNILSVMVFSVLYYIEQAYIGAISTLLTSIVYILILLGKEEEKKLFQKFTIGLLALSVIYITQVPQEAYQFTKDNVMYVNLLIVIAASINLYTMYLSSFVQLKLLYIFANIMYLTYAILLNSPAIIIVEMVGFIALVIGLVKLLLKKVGKDFGS